MTAVDTVNVGSMVIVSARHGVFLFHENDNWIGRSISDYGEWEEPVNTLLTPYLLSSTRAAQAAKAKTLVLDIGAHVGTHALAFAGVGDIIVHAFEPQPFVHAQLQTNSLLLNSERLAAVGGRVVTHNAAVTSGGSGADEVAVPVFSHDESGPMNFGAISLLGGMAAAAAAGEGGEGVIGHDLVDGVSVDAFVDGLSRRQEDVCPALLKIDVEGMENEVIKGAAATLARCRSVIYTENHCQGRSESLITALVELGYDLFWDVFPYYNPGNFFENRDNFFQMSEFDLESGEEIRHEAFSLNMLALPSPSSMLRAGSGPTNAGLEALRASAEALLTRVEPERGMFQSVDYFPMRVRGDESTGLKFLQETTC